MSKLRSDSEGITDKIKMQWVALSAAFVGVGMALSKAIEYMDLGAKAMQAKESFDLVTQSSGIATDALLSNMHRAAAGTMSDSAIMQEAVKGMVYGLNDDQLVKIMEVARIAARYAGVDVQTAYEEITNAIGTNMPRALVRYGLVTRDEANKVMVAMRQGEDAFNLYNLAIARGEVNIAKFGEAHQNAAEKMQAFHAEMKAKDEAIGKAGVDFITKFQAIIDLWDASLDKMNDEDPKADARIKMAKEVLFGIEAETQAQKDAAKAAQDSANIQLATEKAKLDAVAAGVAQKKADLEAMKALDKDYLKSEEDNIKYIVALMTAAGDDEFKIKSDSLQKIAALNADYYARTLAEIKLEADARSKADKDKVSDTQFIADKMKVLDAEMANRAITLAQQQTMLSVQTAQNDIKTLTARLADYQKYYDSLKSMMDKNTADEKKHLDELKAIQKQWVDVQKSTADMIAKINGTTLSPQQTYESGRSALNQQYMNIMNQMTGQEQIKALEDYKQAVAALQQQFAQGIKGPADIFGKPQDILSAAKVAEDAISDINRATLNQQNDLTALSDEKQKQIEADKMWGIILQGEAEKSANSILDIQNVITDLTAKMEAMKKTVEIRGIDQATPVIEGIVARLNELHDKTITITVQYVGAGAGGATSIPLPTPPTPEPASSSISNSQSMSFHGGINIHIPANAASQRPEDWRRIVRNYIVPELKKMNA